MDSNTQNTIEGHADFSGDGYFTLTITDADYTLEDVRNLINDDEITLTYGDTTLFHEGLEIGRIDWDMNDMSAEIAFDDGGATAAVTEAKT